MTLDRGKVEQARVLTGSKSMSDVIDVALDRLIRAERLRRDVEAYSEQPLTDEERRAGDLPVALDLGDDDIDYAALYG